MKNSLYSIRNLGFVWNNMFAIRYMGAIIYDALIIITLFFTITALFVLMNQGKAIPPATGWYQLTLGILGLGYYYCSLKYGGQTLGMKAWKYRLSSLNHLSLSSSQIVKRVLYFIPTLIIAPFLLQGSYQLLNRWTLTSFSNISSSA